MNFSVTNNRLKLSNGYDVSGSVNTTSLLVGTNVGINPFYVLDVSTNNVNAVKLNNTFYIDGSNNRVSIGTNAADTSQGENSIAIGSFAGKLSQRNNAVSIGTNAGVIKSRN